MTDTKILTLHPEGKHGVNISQHKYDTVRAAIEACLRDRADLTFTELIEAVTERLATTFDGSISWYVTTVKLDLEARGVIRRVNGSQPQRLRLHTL